jgi:hypothetical protein
LTSTNRVPSGAVQIARTPVIRIVGDDSLGERRGVIALDGTFGLALSFIDPRYATSRKNCRTR